MGVRDMGASCFLIFGADKDVSKSLENCQKCKICHFYSKIMIQNGGARYGCELLSIFGADKDVSKGCENC